MTAMDHDEWAGALEEFFFRPDFAHKHVLFFVDRAALAAISGLGEDDATRAFIGAIKPRLALMRPSQLFQPVVKTTMKWKVSGGAGSPPCLPALGLAVLAASEMRKTIAVAPNNYYEWVIGLLEEGGVLVEPRQTISAYRDAMPLLWGCLTWWLDEKHRGALGFSTIEKHEHRTKLGYADSQTIFTSSDREKLAQFFRWIGLSPGEQVSEAELIEYFRAWVARRDDVNVGARIMLDDEDEHPAQLAALLARAARGWRGSSRTEEGRREALLRLTLTGPPGPSLGIAAPSPPGFPESLSLSYLGKDLELVLHEERAEPNEVLWYEGLDIPVTSAILETGLSITAEGFAFRLPVAAVHVLHMDPDLGCWASTDRLVPGEKVWLLVRRSRLRDVTGFLEEHAAEDWLVVERSDVAPSGWVLVRDVTLNTIRHGDGHVPEGLAMLVPRETNRFRFSGGLPLPRGIDVYLSGGDPDVTLPPLYEEDRRLRLDDDPLWIGGDADRVSLVGRGLEDGTHVVQLGTLKRSYTTLRTVGNRQPSPERPIGHAFSKGEKGPEPRTLDASELTERAWLTVRGAVVDSSNADFGPPRPPVILPRAASMRMLLGARPGEVEQVATPDKPPWMAKVDLHCREFEHYAGFPVAWMILHWQPGKPSDVQQVNDLPLQEPIDDEGALARWAGAVLSVGDAHPHPGESAWQIIVTAARKIQA